MLIYFLWAIIYYLDFPCVFFFMWRRGDLGVRRVGDKKGRKFPDIPDSVAVAAGEDGPGWMVSEA